MLSRLLQDYAIWYVIPHIWSMDSDLGCSICGKKFEKKKKGYKRRAVSTKLTSPRTFGKVYNKSSPDKFFATAHFICDECYHLLIQKTKPQKKGKTLKRTWNGSPGGTPKRKRPSQGSSTATRKLNFSEAETVKHVTPLEKAVKYMASYKYLNAFRTAVTNSDAAKNALITVASELIKQEVSYFCFKFYQIILAFSIIVMCARPLCQV